MEGRTGRHGTVISTGGHIVSIIMAFALSTVKCRPNVGVTFCTTIGNVCVDSVAADV
jgi:hypothetical protein